MKIQSNQNYIFISISATNLSLHYSKTITISLVFAELLRRKDLKIRQALEEKQQIIANILNIPYEDFESVVDMAGEPTVGNKEPKELVLAAMFQAKCLQESLNEALNLTEGDIVASRASEGKGASLPLYQTPMAKLMNISTTLSQQLSSLLVSGALVLDVYTLLADTFPHGYNNVFTLIRDKDLKR